MEAMTERNDSSSHTICEEEEDEGCTTTTKLLEGPHGSAYSSETVL